MPVVVHVEAVVVDLHIISVHVYVLVGVIEDGGWAGVARVAGHVVSNHQDDLTVRDPESLHTPIDGEHVGDVPIVEPEPGCVHQNSPVVGVA